MSDVDVRIRGDYYDGTCPVPVAILTLRGEVFDTYPCGVLRRRVAWLPLWLPFNSRYDFSIVAQLLCMQKLRETGAMILETQTA